MIFLNRLLCFLYTVYCFTCNCLLHKVIFHIYYVFKCLLVVQYKDFQVYGNLVKLLSFHFFQKDKVSRVNHLVRFPICNHSCLVAVENPG